MRRRGGGRLRQEQVIRDEIGHGVQEAVARLQTAEEAWSRADFTIGASKEAAYACERAEDVFFDPSILSMVTLSHTRSSSFPG
eukprot:750872-Hanusia_phi.AAC.4